MRDVCDLAYVMLLEQLERQTLADRHVAAVLMVAGAKDVKLPDMREQRVAFDESLVAEPVAVAQSRVSQEQQELRAALGVS